MRCLVNAQIFKHSFFGWFIWLGNLNRNRTLHHKHSEEVLHHAENTSLRQETDLWRYLKFFSESYTLSGQIIRNIAHSKFDSFYQHIYWDNKSNWLIKIFSLVRNPRETVENHQFMGEKHRLSDFEFLMIKGSKNPVHECLKPLIYVRFSFTLESTIFKEWQLSQKLQAKSRV